MTGHEVAGGTRVLGSSNTNTSQGPLNSRETPGLQRSFADVNTQGSFALLQSAGPGAHGPVRTHPWCGPRGAGCMGVAERHAHHPVCGACLHGSLWWVWPRHGPWRAPGSTSAGPSPHRCPPGEGGVVCSSRDGVSGTAWISAFWIRCASLLPASRNCLLLWKQRQVHRITSTYCIS